MLFAGKVLSIAGSDIRTPLPPCGQTNASENITLPQPLFVGGKRCCLLPVKSANWGGGVEHRFETGSLGTSIIIVNDLGPIQTQRERKRSKNQ